MYRRIAGVFAATAAALAVGIGPALATSPHFIKTSASGVNNNGSLSVSWKEAGLGNNQNITYLLQADSSAVYACINHGGNHPSASNKETVSGPVSATGTFNSGMNGNISASLTVNPPGPGSFMCPGNQKLVLASVSYSNVSLTDQTNSLTETFGSFSRTFFTI
jgi:hypothetical protein